jgi:hypothetical protein
MALTNKDCTPLLPRWACYEVSRFDLYMYNDEFVFMTCPSIYAISPQMSGIVGHYSSVFLLKISSNCNNFERH